MNRNLRKNTISHLSNRRKRKTLKFSLKRIGIILVVMVGMYIIIGGDSGILRINSLKKEKKQLELQIKGINNKQEALKKKKERLKNDLNAIEKVAREELGMIKDNEIIFRY